METTTVRNEKDFQSPWMAEVRPDNGESLVLAARLAGEGVATLALIQVEVDGTRVLGLATAPEESDGDSLRLTVAADKLPRRPGSGLAGAGEDTLEFAPPLTRVLMVVLAVGRWSEDELEELGKAREGLPGPGTVPPGMELEVAGGGQMVSDDDSSWPWTTLGPEAFSEDAYEISTVDPNAMRTLLPAGMGSSPAGGMHTLVVVGGRIDYEHTDPPTRFAAKRGDKTAAIAQPYWVLFPRVPPLCVLRIPELAGRKANKLELSWIVNGRNYSHKCRIKQVTLADFPVVVEIGKPVNCRAKMVISQDGQIMLKDIEPLRP